MISGNEICDPHVCIEMENVTCRFWYIWRKMDWCIFESLHLFTRDEIATIPVWNYKQNHQLQQKAVWYENQTLSCVFIVRLNRWYRPLLLSVWRRVWILEKDMYLVEYACLYWCLFASVPKCEDCIFGSQCITAICIFHIKHYTYRQRLFQDVFHLHEIWKAILAKHEWMGLS